MALDFPASPTVGQSFTAAGVTWTWDGTKWAASGLSVAYLPLTGGTLSGSLALNAASGTARNLNGETNGSFRWNMQLGNATAESGTAGGSDFALSRFDNTGAYIDSPLTILRGNGVLVAADGVSAPQAIGDNRIINGDMRIDQRNSGASGTAISVYTVDRWLYSAAQAAKGTWGQAGSTAPGFAKSLGFTSSSAYASLAADFFDFYQAIEADMVTDFAWGTANAQPVTLSFWVWSSLTGTFGGSVKNYATTTRSYPFTYSIPVASTWVRIVLTIPGDTAGTWVMSGNAGSMYVMFDLGSGANFRGPANAWAGANYIGATGTVSVVGTNAAQFYVTGVKLEIGSVATPYNRQSLTKSMADCQRYYQPLNTIIMNSWQSSNGLFYTTVPYNTAMRAAPTVAFSSISYSNAANLTTYTVNANTVTPQAQAIAAGFALAQYGLTLTAEL